MGSYIITYDLRSGNPSPYRPFIEEAEKQGLLYVWKGKNKVHRLPNTTLWGRFDGVDAARSAFERALRAASRRVGYAINDEKRVIVRASEVWVKSDIAKTPEAKWTGSTAFQTSRLHQANDPFFAY